MGKPMSERNRAIAQELQVGSRLRAEACNISQRNLARKFDKTPWQIRKALMDGDDPDAGLIRDLAQDRDELRKQLEPYAYPAIAERYGVTRGAVEKVASRMRKKEEQQ